MGTTTGIMVWAHDSGQACRWAFSRGAVEADRKVWFDTIDRYDNMPIECVGPALQISLDSIDDRDIYVG